MKTFSAFRLFYDNFLYRNNVMIEYDKINKYLNKIIEILKKATTVYHDDEGLYVENLTKYQNGIKKELDNIMDVYPYFFEKYYELYNRNVDNYNTISDMPFVISCSFYNDYGNNDVQDDYVQRLTSIDKKRLRDKAKKMSFIQFYKEVLKDFNTTSYDVLIDLLDYFINIDISIKISFEDNKKKYMNDLKKLLITNQRVLEKTKLNDDYNIIKDKMELVYKGCFDNFQERLELELNNYLLSLYENKKKNSSDFYDTIVTNDLSYGLYKDFVVKEKRYKEKFDKIYANKQNVKPNSITVAPLLRKRLIKIYYDSRFLFEKEKSIKILGEKINGIKSLAQDIKDIIWEYMLFVSSHTDYLKRNNTVRYAIINTLYQLYNPNDLLIRYDKVRNELVDYLKQNSDLSNKLELNATNFEELLSQEDIMNDIKKRRKEFIINNAADNLVSKCNDYDTREYDLYYMASDLDINELREIYNELRRNTKIEANDLLNYICQCILLITNKKYDLNKPDYELISEVARSYLNIEYEINLDDDIYMNKRDEFNIAYDAYLAQSSFHKLKGDFRI